MTAPLAPPPYARKPSIVDRVLGRFFPTAQYTGLLDPEAQQGLRQQGLLNLGANLLQAGGASPDQRGTLANIGSSIQGVNFPQMAEHAVQLQAYRQEQAAKQAVGQIVARHPATPGEDRQGAYDRLTAIASEVAGVSPELGARFAPLLQALKPDRPAAGRNLMQVEGVDYRPGSPTFGKSGHWLVDAETGNRVRFEQGPAATAAKIPPKQRENAEFGTAAMAAWRDVDRIRTQNPGVEVEVGKILTSPAFVQAVPGFRHASDAVLAIQKAGGSAAAQNYMRAKWPFLDNIIRTRIPGGRMNGQYLAQVAQEFMPGLDVEGNNQMKLNEIQAMLTAQGEAGFDENPDVWNAAAKRHGVQTLDLQSILQGGGTDSRINRMQARY